MRIVQVLPALPVANRGIWNSVTSLARALRDLGHEVRVLVPTEAQQHLGPHDDLYVFFEGCRDAADQVRKAKGQVHHLHTAWSPVNASVSAALRKCGSPYAYSAHGMLMPAARTLKWWKKRPYWALVESHVVRSAAVCCATSNIESSSLRALYGGAIAVIPNGVPDEPERLGMTLSGSREKTVLFLGRIHPIKNLESLLRASNAMPTGWTMVIAGSGEAAYTRRLEALGRDWGGTRVRFVGEVVGKRKWELISNSSVLVLPSHSENFGNVVLEALAVGTPVIASRATPWAILEDVGAGLWVDCTAQRIRAALVTLGTEPETWRHREEMARRLAQSFHWPLIAARVLEWYREMIRRYEASAEA